MIEILQNIFAQKFSFVKANKEYVQVQFPMYAEDGDLFEIFTKRIDNKKFLITDCGITMMRLSYSYEINSDRKREILNKIITANRVQLVQGEILIETDLDNFEESVYRIAQVIAKISNMATYSREVIKNLFMEELTEFVFTDLFNFHPQKDYMPLPDSPEYKVDFCFNDRVKPIYLYGIHTTDKARITTITCQHFRLKNLSFSSLIVYENMDNIYKDDRDRLLNVSDKNFTQFYSNKKMLVEYLEREYQIK